MYQRIMFQELVSLAQQYRVVAVMGPRQSGKTTLVKQAFPGRAYVNLEIPDQRLAAEIDPVGFLAQFPDGAVLDEIQRVPQLLSYLQAIVDENPMPGRFILTGSHQLELHQALSQSLAGRVGLLNLYPMTQQEVQQAGFDFGLDQQIYHGFYPGIYHDNLQPTQAYRFYVQTYLEKDVRQLSAIHDLIIFQNFLKLCAARIGQPIDYTSFSNDLGVSANTIKNWLSVLEASFVIIRLQPYFENFGRRIIKAARLYFTDVGLAAYLLDIYSAGHVANSPLRGFLLENLVIMDLVKYRQNRGMEPNLYYYRDSQGREIDLIIKSANELIPIEIKAAQTFNADFLKGINYFKNITLGRVKRSYLVYSGSIKQIINGTQLLHYRNATQIFEDIDASHAE